MKYFKKTSRFIIIIIFLSLFFFQESGFLLAQTEEEYINELTKGTPIIEETNLEKLVYNIIQYILSFLGVVAMIVIMYGGYLWMTAGGNEEKVGRAKKTLIGGLIGLVIILLAYAIAAFVITRLYVLGK